MESRTAAPANDAGGVTLREFHAFVQGCFRQFSLEWRKNQRASPEFFPDAIRLDEWWSDFAEFLENGIAQATVAAAPDPPEAGASGGSMSREAPSALAHSRR